MTFSYTQGITFFITTSAGYLIIALATHHVVAQIFHHETATNYEQDATVRKGAPSKGKARLHSASPTAWPRQRQTRPSTTGPFLIINRAPPNNNNYIPRITEKIIPAELVPN